MLCHVDIDLAQMCITWKYIGTLVSVVVGFIYLYTTLKIKLAKIQAIEKLSIAYDMECACV